MSALPPDLARLAEAAGLVTSYWDIAGQQQFARIEPLLAVLRALGLDIGTPDEAATVADRLHRERAQGLVDPVLVHWVGGSFECALRVPAGPSSRSLEFRLQREDGECLRHSVTASTLATGDTHEATEIRRVQLPWQVPPGYHRLEVEVGGQSATSLVVSAPPRAGIRPERAWGVFMPLHALWSDKSWGIGDFGDLGSLASTVSGLGGDLVGTLPLYASFLDHPLDPSPYSPCSRLFWNEVFIDVEAVPEWHTCEEARRLAGSATFQKTLARLRRGRHVDHRAAMRQKRAVLEVMGRHLARGTSERGRQFRTALAQDSTLMDYSRFRAAMEKSGDVWQTWPDRQKSGTLDPSDYDEQCALYHAYVQWLTRSQLEDLTHTQGRGSHLYLDLPLGVHPSGYDVYRNQNLFMQQASAGAPPDTFFSEGQDWGFPPVNPQRLRESGHRYFVDVLRNTFRYATALRMDHIMGLHRLFVIPQGARAREGVYVRFPAEEMYAVLLLEALRGNCRLLVGEDLGTVPEEVRSEMDRRGLARMFVWQYELEPHQQGALRTVPAGQVASLNTHDMPTFTGFCNGTDIHDRFRMNLISQGEVERENARRHTFVTQAADGLRAGGWLSGRATSRSLLTASLTYLAASAARAVVVSLEDLWLEAEPQNIPGTYRERPNWTRRARYPLAGGLGQIVVQKTLKTINRLRKQGPAPHD